MAYRAEIEIGVKGAKQLKDFRASLENTNKVLRQINEENDVFRKPLQSLKIYQNNLKLAAENLENVKAGIKGERDAVRDYLRAVNELNGFKERQNRLLDEEANKLGLVTQKLREYNAAAAPPRQPGGSMAGRYLRPGSAVARTQTASPFGPQPGVQFGSTTQFGPTPLAAPESIFRGQASPVGERISRSLQAAKELDEVYKSIDRIAEKQIAKENERVEALGKGTQEVVELANSYRDITGQTKTQKQVQNEIRRGILETKKAASDEARVRSRDYLDRLRLAERLGEERRNALLLASREEETEKRINAVLERRKKQQQELEAAEKRRQKLIREKARRSKKFNEDLLLGAGFPLLFGGGAGAVGGGVLGAVLGRGEEGFGAQIFFSAIGQQLDALAQNAQELGKALDPLTADIDKVIEAAGTASQVSGQVAKELEELGFKERALEIATEDLAFVVGQDGVDALREFNDSTSELNRAINKLVLDVQVGIARILTAAANFSGTPEQKEIRQARETARGILGAGEGTPELKAAFEKATSSLDVTGAFGAITQAERDLKREVDRIVAERDQALKAELQAAEQKGSKTKDTDARFDLQIEKERSKILALNNDLTNDRVFAAKRSIIFQEAAAKLSKEGLSAEREKQIRLERTNKIQELINERTDLINKNNEKASRASAKAAKEILQTERAIGSEKLKQDELTQKISLVGKDRLTQVRAELNSLDQREVLQRAFIISSTEDVRLQDEKLKTLALQFDLKEAQLRQTEKELVAQREINRLKGEQEVANLRRDLTQELEGLALPTGDPIDDAFINLQREQEARRANVFAGIDQAIAQQKQLLELGQITEQVYNEEIQSLNNKKAAYQELLPVIEAAQRQQLVYNETLNAVQGPVNALVFGLRDVANGTKTAEQAFADFLNVIANQFFTIAARMIAQYIAIGNARNFAFAGAGGAGGGGGAVGGILGLLFGGAFADGGYPPVGKASLVGEKGPELFVPNRAGKIIPNDELGGGSTNNISVSVDARQSEVQGNNDQSRQLGTAISRAIQVELAKQQRPGGLLYSTNR